MFVGIAEERLRMESFLMFFNQSELITIGKE